MRIFVEFSSFLLLAFKTYTDKSDTENNIVKNFGESLLQLVSNQP